MVAASARSNLLLVSLSSRPSSQDKFSLVFKSANRCHPCAAMNMFMAAQVESEQIYLFCSKCSKMFVQ